MTRPCHQHSLAFKTLSIVALIAALVASPARATDFSWANPAGGAYADFTSWTPFDILGGVFGPPGPNDTANFNLGATDDTRYMVFGVAGQSDRLLIGNDALELNIGSGATYELLGASTIDVGIVVGQTSGQTGDLLLTGGGTLEGMFARVGDASGSTGAVSVSGAGSTWDVSGQLDVGTFGDGTLNVQNGGTVTSRFGLISNISGSGAVTVTGAGSTWTGSEVLHVGSGGSGMLNIEAGGIVGSLNSTIASSIGSTGTAKVTGDGSTWTSTGNLSVGNSGIGELNIMDGGVVNNLAGTIASASGSTGAVTVTGTGSTWSNTGNSTQLIVGSAGDGTLNILDGGVVDNINGTIANASSSTSTVTVSGAGSTWTNRAQLFVGTAGNGTLNILAGGTVSNDGSSTIGIETGSTGTVTVAGAGSKWTPRSLAIGSNGAGTLIIQDGGAVSSVNAIRLGSNATSTGAVTVFGDGSTLTSTNSTIVIGVNGDSMLNIKAGGFVGVSASTIGQNPTSTGTVTVTVTGAGSSWTNTQQLVVGSAGDVTLNIEAGGAVSSADGFIGQRLSSRSTATVTGTGSSWTNSGDLYVGGNTTDPLLSDGSGTLNVLDSGAVSVTGMTKIWGPGTVTLNGGTFSTGSLQVLGTFNFDQGTLNLTNSNLSIGPGFDIPGFSDSTMILNPGMALNVTGGTGNIVAGGQLLVIGSTASFSAAGGTNDGQISTIGGSIAYTGPVSNNASAIISAIGATLSFAGDGFPTSEGGNNADGLTNLGTLNLTNTVVNGDVHSPAGSTVNGAGTVVFNGLVSGGANINSNTTTFNGGYSPGDSPAEVSISGDVTLGSSNTLFLELAGTTLGTDYDHLNIAGLLAAGGALDIRLLNSFAPQLGDAFDLLDFGSLVGSFSSIFLPTLADGLIFDTSSLLADGVISVVAGTLGDFDFDGDVDGADFLKWQRGGSPNALSQSDLAAWQTNFGTSTAPLASSQAVPEPSSLALLAIGLLGLCRTRSAFLSKFVGWAKAKRRPIDFD